MASIPQFATFAGSMASIRAAVDAGADHLILEDPAVSVRSFLESRTDFSAQTLPARAAWARACRPDIELSVSIDLLAHHRHFALIEKYLAVVKESDIDIVRIQDPGVAAIVREQLPHAKIHFMPETGYATRESVAAVSTLADRMSLTNDTTAQSLADIIGATHVYVEYLVHGRVLLQYTDRRLLSGIAVNRSDTEGDPETMPAVVRLAIDPDKRRFVFYDNAHGHFMFWHHDKCLLKYMDALIALPLDAWLFDCRGEPDHYLTEVLCAYRTCAHKALSEGVSFTIPPGLIERLEHIAPRSFRPGFFKANNTDSQYSDKIAWKKDTPPIGQVLDCRKPRWIVVELWETLRFPARIGIRLPSGTIEPVTIQHATSLDGTEITHTNAGELFRIDWIKGVASNCAIVRA